MTTNDLDAARRVINRSTEGPWVLVQRQDADRRFLAVVSQPEGEMTFANVAEVPLEPGDDINDWRNDAEFIAAARTLVPALCDEVEQLRAELAKQTDLKKRYARTAANLVNQRDNHAAQADRFSAELAETRAALDHANRELAGTRADRDSAVKANTAWANQTAAKDAVVDAAKTWRWSGDTADGHREAKAALMAAIDALPTSEVAR